MSAAELEAHFQRFHTENPHVYKKLREIALLMQAKGKNIFGIKALFERLRWISTFETEGDIYKLNNNYHALYARLLMKQESELEDFFHTRISKVDSL